MPSSLKKRLTDLTGLKKKLISICRKLLSGKNKTDKNYLPHVYDKGKLTSIHIQNSCKTMRKRQTYHRKYRQEHEQAIYNKVYKYI